MTLKSKYLAIKVSKGLKYIVFGTNIVFIILLVLSTFAPSIPPSHYMIFAFLGMGFPVLLVINVIYLILWIVFLQWKYILVSLLALACCWNSISTYIAFHEKTERIPYDCLKFMTYNVRGFDWLTGEDARENPILEYIAASGADIVCLQEFAVEEKKDIGKLISLEEFDDVMSDYPYRSIIRLGDTKSSTIYGLACYSKYPIRKVARLPIESAFNGSAMYEIQIGKKHITIVNNHLESNRLTAEDKALYKELVENPNRAMLGDVALNIKGHLAPAFRSRESQANIIANAIELQRPETDAMVICGDFNEPPISYTYKKIKGNFSDSFKDTGAGIGITYHENGFWFRIDYIMHTKNMQSFNCFVDRVKYSDHYPLISYLFIRYI
ncbi:MAG: endonuclease/exonuclease/phosphatase family protein [Dysgonomonas sp.]